MIIWDGQPQDQFPLVKAAPADIIARLTRISAAVPPDVELGFHLCYGDFRHRHFMNPRDLGVVTEISNRLSAAAPRPIDWIHLPVPIDRDDDAFFAPLEDLALGPATELYVGLIHFADGVEGAARRIGAARTHLARFGVATECGFGRRPPGTIAALLALHAQVADLLA